MSDSNYTAFEDNIIGAVTRMAFVSPNSLLVYDRGSVHYVVLDVVYCHIYLVYTFRKFACLPTGDIYVLLRILWVVIICFEPGSICLLYLVQNN
jgi:hypothetical protein